MDCTKRLKSLSILFVEDEKSIVSLMQEAIGEMFEKFYTAYDGQEALETFNNNAIDIIVSDIMMPNLNGLEMAKIIKDDSPEIPIVILSAFSEKERLLSAIDVGVDKYLIKPIDPDELIETLCYLAQKERLGEQFVNLTKGFRYDLKNQQLLHKDTWIPLTPKELKFIALLCENKEQRISHRELKRKVWKDSTVSSAAIRAFIKRLRIKTDKELIVNIPKIGYKIALGLS